MAWLRRRWRLLWLVVPLGLYAVLARQASWRPVSLPGTRATVTGLELSTDGRYLLATCDMVTAPEGTAIQLWDVPARTLLHEIDFPPPQVTSVACFTPDHKSFGIATSQPQSQVMLKEYDLQSGQLVRTLPLGHFGKTTHHAGNEYQLGLWYADKANIITISGDTALYQYDGRDGHWLRSLQEPGVKLGDLVWDDNWRTAATMRLVPARFGGDDIYHGIAIWDSRAGRVERVIAPHDSGTAALTLSPDERVLATASTKIKLWDAATGKLLRTLVTDGAGNTSLLPLNFVSYTPDGKTIVAGGAGDQITLWDAATGVVQRTTLNRHGGCTGLEISHDGNTLVVGNSDGTIQFWRIK